MSKQKLKHWWLVLTVCILPMVLTACGSDLSPEEKALKQAAKAKSSALFLLCINLVICVIALLGIIKSNNSAQMGTNTVTRFVRKGVDHRKQNIYFAWIGVMLVIDILSTFMRFHILKLLCFLPPIGVIVFIVFNMRKRVNDKQRIKDARVVTKGSLQVGAGVAKGAVAVAGVAAAVPTGGASLAASAAGMAALSAGGNVMKQAADNMEVEGFKGIDSDQVASAVEVGASKRIEQIADTDLFRRKAMRLGCTEQMSLGEMAQIVLKYAPEASLKELPDHLSDEDKAVALLGAFKEGKKEEVIDAEFREV